ncbi:cytidine deaminase family protein [Nocardiopsis protaetiae]|uniref:cytidine deaminase family protein n=1 Tax=Nocardiopsis protaetiae TaxID=3382270 RepID=UPI00387A93CA
MDKITVCDPSHQVQLSQAAWLCQKRARVYGPTTVGCAVMDENSRLHTGCNVEHRFRSHDIHAETNALGNLVTNGGKLAIAIFIVSPRGWTPCGSCLDWIFELGGEDCDVFTQSSPNSPILSYKSRDLMPYFPE